MCRQTDRQTDITNPTAASHHHIANKSKQSSSLRNAVTHQKGILVNTTCILRDEETDFSRFYKAG